MTLILLVLACATLSFVFARHRALRAADFTPARLHSQPNYHGFYSFLWIVLAGFGFLVLLTVLPNQIINQSLLSQIAQALPDSNQIQRELIVSDAKKLAVGGIASHVFPARAVEN